MIQDVLEILTENLTNERLDGILQQNNEYLEITERVHKCLLELEEIEPDKREVQRLMKRYSKCSLEK